jgi:hypothetical protein
MDESSINMTRYFNTISKLATLSALALSGASFAASGPPGTDIYMAKLKKSSAGIYQADGFTAVTKRAGYDNQPFFLPDGSGLLYTAMLPKDEHSWQSDSFEYHFATKKHTNLTNSTTSEYSPTLMPNGKYFSTIVEREDQQQFWAQPYKNSSKAYRLNMAEPVGYHAWGKSGDLTMFVLGNPNTLQYQQNLKTAPKVVAKDIGRSLRYTKSRNAFSFSQLKNDKKWWLSEYYPKQDKVTALVPMLEGSDYYTWLDDNIAISALGGVIYQWSYQLGKKSSVANWMPWLDVSDYCKTKVSRLAVDKNSQKIAFVCDEK